MNGRWYAALVAVSGVLLSTVAVAPSAWAEEGPAVPPPSATSDPAPQSTDAPPTDAPPTDAPPTDAPPTDPPPTDPQPADPDPSPAEPQEQAALPETGAPAPVARPSRLPLRDGATGWRVRHVQERLQWLGYSIYQGNLDNERMGASTVAAVMEFQSKFGIRPTGKVGAGTYKKLDAIAGKVGRLPKSCRGERTICIDKTQRLVRFVRKDKVALTLDARFGFVGAATREGTFRVHFRSRNHTSSLYRTWMPFALFFSGGQAVHFSPYFKRDGYNGASHGCVNLRDFDKARWLFDQVPLGTRVHVYRS